MLDLGAHVWRVGRVLHASWQRFCPGPLEPGAAVKLPPPRPRTSARITSFHGQRPVVSERYTRMSGVVPQSRSVDVPQMGIGPICLCLDGCLLMHSTAFSPQYFLHSTCRWCRWCMAGSCNTIVRSDDVREGWSVHETRTEGASCTPWLRMNS